MIPARGLGLLVAVGLMGACATGPQRLAPRGDGVVAVEDLLIELMRAEADQPGGRAAIDAVRAGWVARAEAPESLERVAVELPDETALGRVHDLSEAGIAYLRQGGVVEARGVARALTRLAEVLDEPEAALAIAEGGFVAGMSGDAAFAGRAADEVKARQAARPERFEEHDGAVLLGLLRALALADRLAEADALIAERLKGGERAGAEILVAMHFGMIDAATARARLERAGPIPEMRFAGAGWVLAGMLLRHGRLEQGTALALETIETTDMPQDGQAPIYLLVKQWGGQLLRAGRPDLAERLATAPSYDFIYKQDMLEAIMWHELAAGVERREAAAIRRAERRMRALAEDRPPEDLGRVLRGYALIGAQGDLRRLTTELQAERSDLWRHRQRLADVLLGGGLLALGDPAGDALLSRVVAHDAAALERSKPGSLGYREAVGRLREVAAWYATLGRVGVAWPMFERIPDAIWRAEGSGLEASEATEFGERFAELAARAGAARAAIAVAYATGDFSAARVLAEAGQPAAALDVAAMERMPPERMGLLARIVASMPRGTPVSEGLAQAMMRHQRGLAPGGRAAGAAGTVWIAHPGGLFAMDTAKPGRLRVYEVAPFDLARTETTVAQFRACVDAGRCEPPDSSLTSGSPGSPTCNWGAAGLQEHPVTCVHRSQAEAFCSWVGGRLPRREEWQWAAHSAGRPDAWPWGDDPPSCDKAAIRAYKPSTSVSGCGTAATSAVCARAGGMSALGVCDLIGNAREWTAVASGAAADDESEILGGGFTDRHFSDGAPVLTAAPAQRSPEVGFRCARASQPAPTQAGTRQTR